MPPTIIIRDRGAGLELFVSDCEAEHVWPLNSRQATGLMLALADYFCSYVTEHPLPPPPESPKEWR